MEPITDITMLLRIMGLLVRTMISQDGYLLKQNGKVRNSKYTNTGVRKILLIC